VPSRKTLLVLAKEHKINRVQTAIRANYTMGLKFAKWLGLEERRINEKIMVLMVLINIMICEDILNGLGSTSSSNCGNSNNCGISSKTSIERLT
jgi:hypothetical protein